MNENDDIEEIQHEVDDIVTRSGKRVKPVIRTNLLQHNLPERGNEFIE
jgi:hypothetical protein